ncbi:MAG TPA: protein-methionine-sulfoxide reductase heme-binding subunit MsrQ [Myxococcaceae bacterium]|nr:protein-methionine-sulfoxide reductase heme-binding subunit MsrQ [Myxococcaceae bacterium]
MFVGSLAPALRLLVLGARGELGANPIATALNQLGLVALIFLIASLAATPLKAALGWTWPIRIRRMLGLYAFFYASLHFLTYLGLDQVLDLRAVFADITKRKFIAVGFTAFVLLVPLAVTSTDAMVRRLGFVRWKRLHRLVYVAAVLGVVHFIWRVKKDLSQPLTYGAVLALLLAIRVVDFGLRKRKELGLQRVRADPTA